MKTLSSKTITVFLLEHQAVGRLQSFFRLEKQAARRRVVEAYGCTSFFLPYSVGKKRLVERWTVPGCTPCTDCKEGKPKETDTHWWGHSITYAFNFIQRRQEWRQEPMPRKPPCKGCMVQFLKLGPGGQKHDKDCAFATVRSAKKG